MRNLLAILTGFGLALWLSLDPCSPPADMSLDPFVRIQASDGEFIGSGTIIYSQDGQTIVLTAGHVAAALEGSALVEIFCHDATGALIGSRNITGCVVTNTWDGTGFNESTDLALIRLDSTSVFPTVSIHEGPVPRFLTCVSSPAGAIPTPSRGEVVRSDCLGLLQVNAWIFPGSSGGALCAKTSHGWAIVGVAVQAWKNDGYLVGYVSLYVEQKDVREFLTSKGFLK